MSIFIGKGYSNIDLKQTLDKYVMYKFIIMKQTLHAIEVSFQNYHPSKTLADIEGGGGLRVCNPPFQISKIKERNKTKQKMKTILLKRKKKELHVCLVFMCTCVDTCINKHFSFKIFLLKPPLKIFMDPRLKNLLFLSGWSFSMPL